MPDLEFQILGERVAENGLTPLLQFTLEISNHHSQETIAALSLHVQVQIQCPQRRYNSTEKERLSELFGSPDRWGDTLRNRLWTTLNISTPAFTDRTEVLLSIPCSYDLNVCSTKYFHALEGGEVSLLFLFSGTVFYTNGAGLLQTQQISWNKECSYTMPVKRWREAMDRHFPNSAWVNLERGVYDRLYEFRRRNGLGSWEQTINRLLPVEEPVEALA